MIVDASAIVAILRGEAEAALFTRTIQEAAACRISAATYLEAAIVIDGIGDPDLSREFDELVRTAHLEIVAVTEEQARLARQAYRVYGKGSGHRAQLNFGDCFAYALAKATGEALLFKGADFAGTDLASALA